VKNENQAELAGGTELHERHGWSVMMVGCLRVLAYTLLLAALILLTILVTRQLL